MIDPKNPVALAQALVRCPSVTPDDAGALTLLESVLTPLGFDCTRMTMREAGTPDIDNLYARAGTTGPNLCFAGHTDVVPPGPHEAWKHPPFSGTIDGGELHGRGTVDMKGAIACFIAAVARRGAGQRGSISLLITGDEEGPSINGTVKVLDALGERGEKLDACLVGEPTNPTTLGEEIKIGRRGSLNAELVVRGRQGHAAYPQLAENPVPKLIHILDRLARQPLDRGTADFEPTNLQVTVLSCANTATNVIPGEARARFNVRYNTLWTRPKLEAWIRLQCEAAASDCDARWDVTFSGTGDVFLTKPGLLVDTLAGAVESVTGRRPALTTHGGTSDARFIQAVCPVVEFGLTNKLAHHVDERVALADLDALTRIYGVFLDRFLGQPGGLDRGLP
jgi:succinyl-diaminopimelate desuccinylase